MTPISEFITSAETCAVCIGREKDIITHSGILYTTEGNNQLENYFLHLSGPLKLENERIPPISKNHAHYVWFDLKCEEEEKNLLASKCLLIANKNPSLKYGVIHDEKSNFDAMGNFYLGTSASGLTCSTFVKTVLKGQNINIIDDSDWPDDREGDEEWLNYMINMYNENIEMFKNQITKIKNDITTNKISEFIGKTLIEREQKKITAFESVKKGLAKKVGYTFKRFRPEEVIAASISDVENMPLKFECTKEKKGTGKLGEELLNTLPPYPLNK